MRLFRSVGTVAAAVALAATVPASAFAASTRPGSAVPTATASANSFGAGAAQGATSASTPWLSYAVILATLAMGVWIAVHDGSDEPISNG